MMTMMIKAKGAAATFHNWLVTVVCVFYRPSKVVATN